jgi:excisionase family DNA binding protein
MSRDNDNHLAADILRGAEEIANYLGFPRRSIYHAASRGNIPTFRIGDLVCARKSTLAAWISEQERAAA